MGLSHRIIDACCGHGHRGRYSHHGRFEIAGICQGYTPRSIEEHVHRYLVWGGVEFSFRCGLFANNPAQFLYHPIFWIKIGLMVVGVISAIFLLRELTRSIGSIKAILPSIRKF